VNHGPEPSVWGKVIQIRVPNQIMYQIMLIEDRFALRDQAHILKKAH
jgi:hypothetical protein